MKHQCARKSILTYYQLMIGSSHLIFHWSAICQSKHEDTFNMLTSFQDTNPFGFTHGSIEIPTFTFENMPLLGESSADGEVSMSSIDMAFWSNFQSHDIELTELNHNPTITFTRNLNFPPSTNTNVELPVFNQPANQNTTFYTTLIQKFLENTDSEFLSGESKKAKRAKKSKKNNVDDAHSYTQIQIPIAEQMMTEIGIDEYLCDLNIGSELDDSQEVFVQKEDMCVTESNPDVATASTQALSVTCTTPKDPFHQLTRIRFGRKSIGQNSSNQKMESDDEHQPMFDYKMHWLLNEFEDIMNEFVKNGQESIKKLFVEAKTSEIEYGQKCLLTFYNFVIDISIQRYESKHVSSEFLTDEKKAQERDIIESDAIELFPLEMQQKIAQTLATCELYRPRKRTINDEDKPRKEQKRKNDEIIE